MNRQNPSDDEPQAFLFHLSDVLRMTADPIAVEQAVTKMTMDYFGADRCYYCRIEDNTAIINRDALRFDLPSVAGVYSLDDFAIFKKVISEGNPFVVYDSRSTDILDPELRELCIQLQVISFIDVPVVKDGKPRGIFCLVQSKPRAWGKADVHLVVDIAERTWVSIERAQAEQTAHINEERMRAMKEAYQSVANAGKIEDSLRRLTELVAQETGGEARTAFYFVSTDGERLNSFRDAGTMSNAFLDEIDNFPIDEDSFACGLAVREGKPIIISDVLGDPRWKGLTHIAEKHNYRACWAFPIKTRDHKTVGTFAMYFDTVRRPSAQNLSLADVVTQTAAVVISNHHDNVERTKAESLLKEVNAKLKEMDVAKTNFFNNVSHEFRTPLTLLMSPLEEVMSNSKARISAADLKKLEIVHHGAMRLQKLVNTLLDFARMEAGKLETFLQPTDFSQISIDLASNFRSAIEKAGLKFVIKTEPINEPVYLNREMWEKIVLNLLSNAFKFTQKGKIEVIIRNKKKNVEFRVKDTGIGIAQKNITKIFERFTRIVVTQARTYEGTGIGLALVKDLVTANGGTIRVISEENVGSEFIVSIPKGKSHLSKRQIYESKARVAAAPLTEPFVDEISGWRREDEKLKKEKLRKYKREGALRLIIAEDNADMRDYLVNVLSEDKYEILAFEDGMKVLTFLRQGGEVDLIVTDVMMPVMDGYELVEWLKSDVKFSGIPVIMLSAKASEDSRIEGLKVGADGYLVKPFSAKELRAIVWSRIKQRRLE